MTLESSRGQKAGGRSGRSGMLTRRRHEVIESHKFTEARLESLYSSPPEDAAAATSRATRTRSSSRKDARSMVASRKTDVTKSSSVQSPEPKKSEVPATDRQTRNTPAKLEAKSSQDSKKVRCDAAAAAEAARSSPASRGKTMFDVIVIDDDSPVKRSRRSLPNQAPASSELQSSPRTTRRSTPKREKSKSLLEGLHLSSIPLSFKTRSTATTAAAAGSPGAKPPPSSPARQDTASPPRREASPLRTRSGVSISPLHLSRARRSPSVTSTHSDSSTASSKTRPCEFALTVKRWELRGYLRFEVPVSQF